MTTYLTHTFSNRELKTFSYPNQTRESVSGTHYKDTLCLKLDNPQQVEVEDSGKEGIVRHEDARSFNLWRKNLGIEGMRNVR